MGVPLLTPQDAEEPACRPATEHLVRDIEGDPVTMGGIGQEMPYPDHRLYRAGLVDEGDLTCAPLWWRTRLRPRRWSTLPATESPLEVGDDLVGVDITGDDYQCIAGPKVRLVERDDILPRDSLDRFWCLRCAIGVLPIDLLHEDPRCDRGGLAEFCLECR